MSNIAAFLNQSEQYLADAAITPDFSQRALGHLTESLGLGTLFVCFSVTSLLAILGL